MVLQKGHRVDIMSETFYESIIEQFPLGFIYLKLLFDDKGGPFDFEYLKVNQTYQEMTRIDSKALVGNTLRNHIKQFDLLYTDNFNTMVDIALHGGTKVFDLSIVRTERSYKVTAFSPQQNYVYLFFNDVTAQIRLPSDLDVFFQISPDLLSISRVDGMYIKVNPAWKKILGYDVSEVEGKYSWQFLHPDDQINNRTLAKQLESSHQVISFINRYRHKDGTYRVVEWDSQLDGNRVYSVARDVTERNLKEEQIEYLSFHDMLTGLYNRRFLEEEMKRLDVPRNLPLTVIMGDVNRLKLVNDAFGHDKGDELIIKAAESIKNSVRPEDLVARWGGDEFFILLPKTTKDDAAKIVERIHTACMQKNVNSIGVSIAFGIASKAFLSDSLTETMRLAEDAMYKSKTKDGERTRRDIIDVIATTLYSKIPFEEQHAKRVSFLCQQMASALGFCEDDIHKLTLAGLLHDIGKVAVSSEILRKTTPLTSDEWSVMKTHTEIGAKVVGNGDSMGDVGQAILYHHERYDGSGYPKGIRWDEIPIASRIITLADSYDTMISQSMYKPCKTRQEAIAEIRKNKGTQFDPKLAEIFVKQVLGEKSEISEHH